EATPVAADGGAAPVAIIRILGASGELLALYYDEGTLYFERTGTVDRTAERADLLSNDGRPTDIGLGIRFDCFVRVTLEGVSVSVIHNGTSYSAQRDADRAWFGQPLHFNAGISLASKELVGTAKVKFYLLTVPKRNSSDRSSGVAKKRRLHLGVPGTRQ
ncbi:MAG TPA: hypothetical protein VL418_08075, partial [Devosiaceae bacterium]|nr:hypothetical protein [Devosiaceae bacterium]